MQHRCGSNLPDEVSATFQSSPVQVKLYLARLVGGVDGNYIVFAAVRSASLPQIGSAHKHKGRFVVENVLLLARRQNRVMPAIREQRRDPVMRAGLLRRSPGSGESILRIARKSAWSDCRYSSAL